MCGIVAYLGRHEAAELLLTGLRRLEYRGYDSAGMATLNGHGLDVRRSVGRVERLAERLQQSPLHGQLGIAHTRWATHGKPSEANAHPHLDQAGRVALVHNGVIENHNVLREFLQGQGIQFSSDTDTEIIAQLIGYFLQAGATPIDSVRQALRKVCGTYGLAVLFRDLPDQLVGARRGSPLLAGLGQDEFLLASDPSAVVGRTRDVMYLNDDEIVVISRDGIEVSTIDAAPVEGLIETLDITLEEIELAGYEHYMLREINEQPESLKTTMGGRLLIREQKVKLAGLDVVQRELPSARRALLFGCGTAWHAALIAEYLFEELAGIPTEVEYACELRYRNRIVEPETLAIAVSQSGETADTLAALREVQARGALTLGVVNVVGSSIARETDAGVYLRVGHEIGVASTKAFTAQVAVLSMMAIDLGRRRHLAPDRVAEMINALAAIPHQVSQVLELDAEIQTLAESLAGWNNWLYLGRGVNYPVALEGALKLKEISYIHAEGLPAAEMKHGPIAMIDSGMPVVVIAIQDHTYDKVLANIEEVRSRDGRIIAIATEGDRDVARISDHVIYVPATQPLLSPLLTTIPLQLLAYHVAVARGCDVDKPRNLAKSVTVE